MKVAIGELRKLMIQAMLHRRIGEVDAAFIVSDYLDAELEGRRTHGVGKFLLIDHALSRRRGTPQVSHTSGAVAYIDGNADIGQIAARLAAQTAIDMAKQHGIGLAALRNYGRFSRLSPYVELIASEGLVAIALNNAGPPAVAPFGSRTPILGTNPIAFAFPGSPEPTVIDFATSKAVWGQIRQSQLEDKELPADAFIDKLGTVTRNPAEVNAVLPFGDAKGSALCLAVELMAGTIAGAAMGLHVTDETDLGAIFIAIRPAPASAGVGIEAIRGLLDDIRSSQPRRPGDHVRIPGENSRNLMEKNLKLGELDVDPRTLQLIERMAVGGAGLEADNLNN
jgi:LDH2 family malate/lactate/ureidoglycolate dehydrogenase